VFEMHAGTIRRAREYFDTSGLAAQLGVDSATLARLYTSLAGEAALSASPAAQCDPVDVVKTFIQAWNNRDLDGLLAVLAPSVSGRNPLSPREADIPNEAAAMMVRRYMAAFPDLRMRVDAIVAAGAVVAVEETETATLSATGRSYTMPVSCFFTVGPEGQITRIHNYWDTGTYFEQLDATPQALTQILSAAHTG
jgi:ketosteroid isomerase-like protein